MSKALCSLLLHDPNKQAAALGSAEEVQGSDPRQERIQAGKEPKQLRKRGRTESSRVRFYFFCVCNKSKEMRYSGYEVMGFIAQTSEKKISGSFHNVQ